MTTHFKAVQIHKEPNYQAKLTELKLSDFSGLGVDIDVEYSTLNYKDALAITGKAPVVRQFPLIPGIDLAGTITHSSSNEFEQGQKVILNGYGVGEIANGGLSQFASLKDQWLIPLPASLTSKQAMQIGTAGYTAMLSIIALENQGVKPEHGEVLVTGANGGVGSFAIYLLNKLGFDVVATTGRMNEATHLESLGAKRVLSRDEFSSPGKPLAKEQFAAAIDSVGSHTLANVCASVKYGGVVTACGLAQGMDFPATVAPFILRGVSLIGIDSVMRPKADRIEAWQRLSELVDGEHLNAISQEISLSEAINHAEKLLNGEIRGRVVVNCKE